MGLIIFLFLVGEAVDSLFLKKYNARIAEQRRAERLAARRLDALTRGTMQQSEICQPAALPVENLTRREGGF